MPLRRIGTRAPFDAARESGIEQGTQVTPDILKFLLILAKAATIFVIYIICAVGVYALFRRAVKSPDYAGVLFGIAMVIGPVLMSWILTMMLLALPGQSRLFYILGPVVPFALIIIFSSKGLIDSLKASVGRWRDLTNSGVERAFWTILALFVLFVVLGVMVTLSATTPIHGNDSIEYQIVGRTVAQALDGNIYPILDQDTANGFNAPWTHPMGYINLLAHAYLVQGFVDTSGVARFVAPYFGFSLIVLMLGFGGFRNLMAGAVCAVFMACTPVFLHLVLQSHIDPIRLATLTAAVAAIWLLSQINSWRLMVLAGLTAGCAMFVHSIGIVTLPLAIPTYILIARRFGFLKHSVRIIGFSAIAIAMLIPRYIINYNEFGSVIADSIEVWEIESVAVEHTRLVTRYMETTADKIVNGALMGLTETGLFGWFQILFFVALLVLIIRTARAMGNPFRELVDQRWREWGDPSLAALLVALGYIAMMVLTILMGSDLAVKNARYIMTMQPFMILFGARYLTILYFERFVYDAEDDNKTGLLPKISVDRRVDS